MRKTLYPGLFERQPKLAKAILLLLILGFILWIIMPLLIFQNKKVLSELETDYRKFVHPSNTTLINYETFYKPGTSLVRVDGKFQTTLPFSEVVDAYNTQLKSLGWVFLKQSNLDVNSRYYVLYCKGYWLTTKIEQEQSGYLISLNRGYDYDCASGNMNPWNVISMLTCLSPFFIIGCAAIWFSVSNIRWGSLRDSGKAKSGWVIFVGIFFVLFSSMAILFAAKSLIWYIFAK